MFSLNCRKLRICWLNFFILCKDTSFCLGVFYVLHYNCNQICALLLRYERFGVLKCQHLICSVKMALVMTWPALLCVQSKIKYALLGVRQQRLAYIVSNWVFFFSFLESWKTGFVKVAFVASWTVGFVLSIDFLFGTGLKAFSS